MSLQHKPFAALRISTWGQALARCRMERSLSHREVADRSGASPTLVRDWEMGLAYPSRPQLKRLENMCFRQLRYFTGLLPAEMQRAPAVKPSDPDEAFVPSQADGPPPPELAPPPEPKTFSDALRQARTEEGLDRRELAEVLGVTDRAIDHWENGVAKPYRQNYDKLLALFPSLGNVPRPVGMRELAPPPLVPPAAPPLSPPPITVAPSAPAPSIADVGAAYAMAMAETARLIGDLEKAKARVATLEAAVDESRKAITAAHEKLLTAVGGVRVA